MKLTLITTTIEQAEAIRSQTQSLTETRKYWEVVADVMNLSRDTNFVWEALGSSSRPDRYNRLLITVMKP